MKSREYNLEEMPLSELAALIKSQQPGSLFSTKATVVYVDRVKEERQKRQEAGAQEMHRAAVVSQEVQEQITAAYLHVRNKVGPWAHFEAYLHGEGITFTKDGVVIGGNFFPTFEETPAQTKSSEPQRERKAK